MKLYLYAGIACIISFLAGKYVFPPAPVIEEKVRTVTVEKYIEKRNTEKVTKVTEKPDGTKITEVTEKDKSTIVDNTNSRSDKSTEVKPPSKITLGLLAIKDFDDFSKTDFGATVTVPVFGNIKAQFLGTTGKQIGVGLALEF